ncbi:MAG: hypothetical protein KC592_12155 [Nitrospira sp.]|nr:hypothetical protein [Nitrospira sp.]
MSLNLSLITPRYVCQLSDRRLRRFTSDGTTELDTDNSIKLTTFGCRNARVSIAFHGIGGHSNGTLTEHWLLETLQEFVKTNDSIETALKKLGQKTSLWIKGIRARNPSDLRHSFVITGWTNTNIPFIFLLSNYQRLTSPEKASIPWPEFKSSQSYLGGNASPNGFSFFRGGDTRTLSAEDIELINRTAQEDGAKVEDVVKIMSRAINNAAKKSRSKGISETSISSILLPGNPEVKWDQHYETRKEVGYMPNLVSKITMWGMEFHAGAGVPPWVIRDTRKLFSPNENITKGRFIKAMRNVPSTFRTGDQIPLNLDPVITKFLMALPPGLNQREIENAL